MSAIFLLPVWRMTSCLPAVGRAKATQVGRGHVLKASHEGAAGIRYGREHGVYTEMTYFVSNKCVAVRKVATPLRELTCHMGYDTIRYEMLF